MMSDENSTDNRYRTFFNNAPIGFLVTDPNETTAGFTVKDDAAGIPDKEIDQVTEPFFTTKHKGLGLGLTISEEIVKQHGGNLEVESAEGESTIVTVTLSNDM